MHPQTAVEDTALKEIHRRLTSTEKLTYHKPMVFEGEITALGSVFQGVCKSAVSQEVEFTVSRVLFGNVSDKVVHDGFINCTMPPLPSPPFTLHAMVIVYCERLYFLNCVNPVPYTEAKQKTIDSWIAAIPADLAKEEDDRDTSLETLHGPVQNPVRLAEKRGLLFDGDMNRKLEIRQPDAPPAANAKSNTT